MSQPDGGGAAFNPMVRTEDNTPEPDEARRDIDEAEDGQTGKEPGDGLR